MVTMVDLPTRALCRDCREVIVQAPTATGWTHLTVRRTTRRVHMHAARGPATVADLTKAELIAFNSEEVSYADISVGDLISAVGAPEPGSFHSVRMIDVVSNIVTFTLDTGTFVCGDLTIRWYRSRQITGHAGESNTEADRLTKNKMKESQMTIDAVPSPLETIQSMKNSGDKKWKVELTNACRAEAAAVKEATKNGTPVPETPVTDWSNSADYEGKTPVSPTTIPRSKVEQTVEFTLDGKLVGASQHKLSSIAGYTEKAPDADGKGGQERWSTKQFINWLVEKGITEPLTTEWTVTLPVTGRVISTYLKGTAPRVAPAPAAAKAAGSPKKSAARTKASPQAPETGKKAPTTMAKVPAVKKVPAARKATPVTKSSQLHNNGKASALKSTTAKAS